MAFANQETKKKIQAALKPVLAKYGLKGTLRIRNHMSVDLTLRAGSVDFIADLDENYVPTIGDPISDERRAEMRGRYHFDINQYWYHEQYKGVSKQALGEIVQAMQAADWYDKSDISTDYFHTAYYYNVTVGAWNKPYCLTN